MSIITSVFDKLGINEYILGLRYVIMPFLELFWIVFVDTDFFSVKCPMLSVCDINIFSWKNYN